MVAGVIVLARIIGGVTLVMYLLVWTPFAFIVLVTWDEPKNWIAWLIVLVNPVTIGVAAGLFTRVQQRQRYG